MRASGVTMVTTNAHQQVADQPQIVAPGFVSESQSELTEAIRLLARSIQENARYVDEYNAQSVVPTSVTSISVKPQFEEFYELIKRVVVTGPTSTSLAPAEAASGPIANPGSGATIVSLGVLPAGTYQVYWEVGLEGTVTAADGDNMKVVLGASNLLRAEYPGVVGEYPQQTFQFTSDGTSVTKIITVAASSGASASYNAQISCIPINVPVTFVLQLGDRFWTLSLPSTGLLEFSCEMLLGRNDLRQVTSTFAGSWNLELMGHADVRNRS
jgi:hypothetical protein